MVSVIICKIQKNCNSCPHSCQPEELPKVEKTKYMLNSEGALFLKGENHYSWKREVGLKQKITH